VSTPAKSALGQMRTNLRDPKPNFVCSCPKADNRECGWIVRFVPIATTERPSIPIDVFPNRL